MGCAWLVGTGLSDHTPHKLHSSGRAAELQFSALSSPYRKGPLCNLIKLRPLASVCVQGGHTVALLCVDREGIPSHACRKFSLKLQSVYVLLEELK